MRVTDSEHGQSSNAVEFYFEPEMVVSSVYPKLGPARGGTKLFVSGSGIPSEESLGCDFGAYGLSPATWLNETSAECFTPAVELSRNSFKSDTRVRLVVGGGIGTSSASSASFSFYADPDVVSMTPSFGSLNGGTPVIIKGSNFDAFSEICALFGGKDSSIMHCSHVGTESVLCKTPRALAAATVEVALSGNCFDYGGLNATLSFNYVHAPTVSSIFPGSGPLAGGTKVKVSGNHFTNTSQISCSFGSSIVPGVFVSSAQVECTAPPSSTKGLAILEVTTNGVDFTASSMSFRYAQAPRVASITPATGPVSGGTAVTVLGSGFLDSTTLSCRFVDGQFVSAFVFLSGGFANIFRFLFCCLPSTLSETGAYAEATAVYWISPHAVLCVTPQTPTGESQQGKVSVFLTSNGVDYTTEKIVFTYHEAITVTSATSGAKAGEITSVFIVRGAGFHLTDDLRCKFGDDVVVASYLNSSAISCNMPISAGVSGATGITELSVSNNGIDFAGSLQLAMPTTVKDFSPSSSTSTTVAVPWVGAITPLEGPAGTSVPVSVIGMDFINSAKLRCKFGSEMSPATWVSANQVACHSPATAKSGEVLPFSVSNDGGQVFSSSPSVNFVVHQALSISSIMPGLVVEGAEVPIDVQGTGFLLRESLRCKFGTTHIVNATFINATTVRCRAPAIFRENEEGKARVAVSVNGRNYVTNVSIKLAYVASIKVATISPSSSNLSGGTQIHVAGSGFVNSTDLWCKFAPSSASSAGAEGASVAATYISSSLIRCTAPSAAAVVDTNINGDSIDVTVAVSLNRVQWTPAPVNFRYFKRVTRVTKVWPRLLTVGVDAVVKVYGSGFYRSPSFACYLGPTKAFASRYISSRYAECIFAKGMAEGVSSLVRVTNNGVTFSQTFDALQITYVKRPSVNEVIPSTVQTGVQYRVLVRGTDFKDSEDLTCRFGTRHVRAQYVNSSAISCTAWQMSPANVSFSVSVNKIDFSTDTVFLNFIDPPSVLSIHPNLGANRGNTILTITGDNFPSQPGLMCSFASTHGHGTASTAATRINNTHITCPSPSRALLGNGVVAAGALGVHVGVRLTVTDNSTASNTKSIQILNEFDLTFIEPAAGSPNMSTFISVYGYGFVDSPSLKCRIQSELLVTAHFVSERELLCEIPPRTQQSAGTVADVDLTMNGVDFSSHSASFHYHDGERFCYYVSLRQGLICFL